MSMFDNEVLGGLNLCDLKMKLHSVSKKLQALSRSNGALHSPTDKTCTSFLSEHLIQTFCDGQDDDILASQE